MHLFNLLWWLVAIVSSRKVLAAPTGEPTWSSWTPLASTPSSSTSGTPWPSSTASICSSTAPATSLSIALSAPSNAVQVPGDFVGFGFETAFLNNYAVGNFSENLVNSVAKRLCSPVIIRIGGTSGDRVLFDPDQEEAAVCIDGDCPVGSDATYILGPSYFEGFKRFQNQHFTFQAPLGPDVNTTGSLDYVVCAYNALGADRVAGIALGNEPDLYASPYTAKDYIHDAKALEHAITDALNLSSEQRIFEVLDLAGGGHEDSGFTAEHAFKLHIDRKDNTKYAAQHWYQIPLDFDDFSVEALQSMVMNHSAITSKFDDGYIAALRYVEANMPDVDYILSETGSGLKLPPLEFQDAFGACLWAVDFNLYAMSLGVKRLDATQRPAAPHSLFVPDTSTNDPALGIEYNMGPQVRGPYFAVPMVADFVGQNPGSVVQLLGEDLATAYAMYDLSSGLLEKVALVNLKYWSADTDGERGNMTFSIPIPDSNATSVVVQRLRADAGAHAQGYDVQGADGMITWAGETWSYDLDNGEGHLVTGVPVSEEIEVCNRMAWVDLEDSGAAIVYLERRIELQSWRSEVASLSNDLVAAYLQSES